MAEPLIIDPNDRDKRLVLDPRTGRMSQVEVDSRLNDNLAGVYRQAYSAGADLAAGYQASLQVVRPGDEVLEPAPPAQQNPAAPGVQQNPAVPGVQQNPAAPGPPLKKRTPADLLKLGSFLRDKDDIEVEVNLDNKGGKSRHRDFVNFLATDKVPDSIFGIPVVQDESQYTEKDLEFFKRNPKAAGFYDLGDGGGEPPEEPPPEEPPPGGPGPDQGAQGGGDAGPIDAPTLSDDRPMHFFRDAGGKITGYGTTRSMVHEDNGKFFVIPTILDDGKGGTRAVSDEDAIGWYSETGEHWGSYATPEAADAAAHAVHERHQKLYGRAWNEYIQDHWDDMADSIREDPGVAALHKLRSGKYPGAWNNPGNVEPGEVQYSGESGTVTTPSNRTFLKFRTPQDGLNAMAQAVGQIARRKIPKAFREGRLSDDGFTVENLVKVYAPQKDDNKTDEYISFVADRLGVDGKTRLSESDAGQMATLLEAMVRRDSGHQHADWFRAADYTNAAGKMSTPALKRKGGK